jgi:hypothetical protein
MIKPEFASRDSEMAGDKNTVVRIKKIKKYLFYFCLLNSIIFAILSVLVYLSTSLFPWVLLSAFSLCASASAKLYEM